MIGSGDPVDVFCQGRFLSLVIEADENNAPWRLGSIDIEYRMVGQW